MNALTVEVMYRILEDEVCRGNGDMQIWIEVETETRRSWVGPAVVSWLGESDSHGKMVFLSTRRDLMTKEEVKNG